VNAANPGDVIVVDPGTYNENVTINTGLSLRGANYGVSCSGAGARGAESVVNGTAAGNFATIKVNADNVTIDGFTITNPSGFYGVTSSRSSLTVAHNIITNIGTAAALGNHYGVYFEVGSAAPSSNLAITDNCINNVRGTTTDGGILIGSSTATQVLTGANISQNIIGDIKSSTRGAYGVLINTGDEPFCYR
jgi:hypothetical protein